MTRENFINNIKELEKKLDTLKSMSFENWFYNIWQQKIIENQDEHFVELFNRFEELYFTKKTLNEYESKEKEKLLEKLKRFFNYDIVHLETQIKDNYENLKFFTNEENLDIKTWFNKYYAKLIDKSNILEQRKLALKIIIGEIDEFETYKNTKDKYKLIEQLNCLQQDYFYYKKEQLTKVTNHSYSDFSTTYIPNISNVHKSLRKMTKENFINNMKELKKQIDILENISFENWFYNIWKQEIIEKNTDDINLFNKFEELYFTKKTLTKEEKEEQENLLKIIKRKFDYYTQNLSIQITEKSKDLKYFVEEDEKELNLKKWFDKYYEKIINNPDSIKLKK